MTQDSVTQQALRRPLVELPADSAVEIRTIPAQFAAPAVTALGWHGAVLPPVALLGRRVVVVAELIEDAHTERVEAGWVPVLDRTTVSTWDWPELQQKVPPVAARLVGVIASARHWRTGLFGVTAFAGMCATAMVLPADVARDGECRRAAQRYGVSVVATAEGNDVDLVQPGRPGPATTTRPSVATRWVNEVIYERLLAHGR